MLPPRLWLRGEWGFMCLENILRTLSLSLSLTAELEHALGVHSLALNGGRGGGMGEEERSGRKCGGELGGRILQRGG